MIAVAIVAVLAAIALPSYQAYVLRANRTTGKTFMADLLSRQESFFADRKRYASALSEIGFADTIQIDREGKQTATDAIYSITLGAAATSCPAAASGTPSDSAFMLFAVPTGVQAGDTRCGTLCLSSTGYRGASGSSTDCWTR